MAQPKSKPQEKEKHKNKKAFTYSGGTLAHKKRMQRLGDLQAKRDRKTVIDKTPQSEGPPFVVVVQGPPQVGKTTLIRSLVKHYSKTTLGGDIEGPVTLVSGRIRRLTFIECPANDMRAMLDLGKVADLVLLMVDGSQPSGFEMETFEFINILQVHGFPRVIGVLTHLDRYKETKRLRKTKKTFKERFWSELYDGAKMFYLSGLQYGNRYNKTEVMNLARFISVQRFPPLTWRQTHPYVFGLRAEIEQREDNALVPSEDANNNSQDPLTMSIYGYVAGSRLREGQLAHIPGVGDYPIAKAERVLDPCPLPQQIVNMEKGANAKNLTKSAGAPLRTLADKHKSIYAPYCDAEHIAVEKNAMYITLRNHGSHFTREDDMGVKRNGGNSDPESSGESGGSDNSSDDEIEQNEAVRLVRAMQDASRSSRTVSAEEDSTDAVQFVKNGVSIKSLKEEDSLSTKATSKDISGISFEGGRKPLNWLQANGQVDENLHDLVYRRTVRAKKSDRSGSLPVESLFSSDDEDVPVEGLIDEVDDELEVPRRRFDDTDDSDDSQSVSELAEMLRRKKVFSSATLGSATTDLPSEDSDSELDCDSGDEETVFSKEREENAKLKEAAVVEGEPSALPTRHLLEGVGGVISSVARLAEEGAFEIGQFVKLTFENIPCEFAVPLTNPKRPLIVGGIATGAENRQSHLLLHIKRHRWSPKILKNLDPVLVSVGWKRFQSMPVYSMEDRSGEKLRMLKYTPEHMHCYASVCGPSVAPNTGVMFIRDWRAVPSYRVSASGVVVEGAEKLKIVKKIKLVGEPYKVHEKTAFIKGMFTSDLEVQKSLHARIQTVSGIAGEIKKAVEEKGNFRATFGHKIQMSDLVMLKAWVPVEIPSFCNVQLDVDVWPRMRTVNEIRRDSKTPIPHKPNSSYGNSKQDRSKISNKFSKIRVPTKLQNALPFKSKLKVESAKPKKIKKIEKQDIVRGAGQIVLPGSSSESKKSERKVRALLHGLKVVRRARVESRKEKSTQKKELKQKREAFVTEKREAHKKENRKRQHAKAGFREKQNQKRMRLNRDSLD